MILSTLQLTTRDQLFEDDTLLETIDVKELSSDWFYGAEEHCLRWKSALSNFFAQGTEVCRLQTKFLKKANCLKLKVSQELEAPAVNALREMRKWTHNTDDTCKSWMESVILVNTTFFCPLACHCLWHSSQSSGLGHEILRIANPVVSLENKTPYLSLSFQRYRWKESLLSCLLKWVDRVLPPRTETSHCTNENAQEFLQLLSQHHACPFRSNYSSVFAFSSEKCFLAESTRWMLPTLVSKASSVTWVSALLPVYWRLHMYSIFHRYTRHHWTNYSVWYVVSPPPTWMPFIWMKNYCWFWSCPPSWGAYAENYPKVFTSSSTKM